MIYYGEYRGQYIAHFGRSKTNGARIGSGRYPLGSGKRPYQSQPQLIKKIKTKRDIQKLNKINTKREASEMVLNRIQYRRENQPTLSQLHYPIDALAKKVNTEYLRHTKNIYDKAYRRLVDSGVSLTKISNVKKSSNGMDWYGIIFEDKDRLEKKLSKNSGQYIDKEGIIRFKKRNND